MTPTTAYDAKQTAEILKAAHNLRNAMVRDFFAGLYARLRGTSAGSAAIRAN